eukprot:gene6811-4891_t
MSDGVEREAKAIPWASSSPPSLSFVVPPLFCIIVAPKNNNNNNNNTNERLCEKQRHLNDSILRLSYVAAHSSLQYPYLILGGRGYLVSTKEKKRKIYHYSSHNLLLLLYFNRVKKGNENPERAGERKEERDHTQASEILGFVFGPLRKFYFGRGSPCPLSPWHFFFVPILLLLFSALGAENGVIYGVLSRSVSLSSLSLNFTRPSDRDIASVTHFFGFPTPFFFPDGLISVAFRKTKRSNWPPHSAQGSRTDTPPPPGSHTSPLSKCTAAFLAPISGCPPGGFFVLFLPWQIYIIVYLHIYLFIFGDREKFSLCASLASDLESDLFYFIFCLNHNPRHTIHTRVLPSSREPGNTTEGEPKKPNYLKQ